MIDIKVVEELVLAFEKANKECPDIHSVYIGTDGFNPAIIVQTSTDHGDDARLRFPTSPMEDPQ